MNPAQQRCLSSNAQTCVFVHLAARISVMTIPPVVHLFLFGFASDLQIARQVEESTLIGGRRQLAARQVTEWGPWM